MDLAPIPSQAAWRHTGAREGFEVVFVTPVGGVHRFRGSSAGVEDGTAWSLGYDLSVGADGLLTTAILKLRGRDGEGEVLLERDDDDRWSVDGLHRPDLDGLGDIDLAGSLLTNTFPLRRLDLTRDAVSVPTVFVGLDLAVSRMEQTYASAAEPAEVAYTSSTFDFATTLRVDHARLVLDYPPLGMRHS